MSDLAFQVASRYQLRAALQGRSAAVRTAALPPMVEVALAEAFWIPAAYGKRTAGLGGLGNVVKRVKELSKAFAKAPKLWDGFKKMLGVESMTELPGALKVLADKGKAALKKVFADMFESVPLKLYRISGTGLNDLLESLVRRIPGMDALLAKVKAKGDELGFWLKEKVPVLSTAIVVAVFIFIWLNVVEFEWNIHDLSRAITGQIHLGDLLASLPGSAIGFLMNGLGLGTFTLLPISVAVRTLYLLKKGYLVWNGRWFDVDEKALNRDGLTVKPA